MAEPRIAILGTGLIGSSIGLGLRAREGRKYEVIGVDADRGRARTAKKIGAIDREVGSLQEAVEGAGLVIVAVPVLSARDIFEGIAPYLAEGAVVTDVCSTKADVMLWAAKYLPSNVSFIGGHPMAGKETSGPEAASADLFRGATWAVVPSPKASEEAVRVVLGLIEWLGANPVSYDAEEHDQYVAAVSHVPILVSVGLFRMVRQSTGWEDAAILAGPGFRDLTRLASGDPTMSGDIMVTNREAVLHWLGRFREAIDEVTGIVAEGGERMAELFVRTSLDRDTFLLSPPERQPPRGPETPSSQDAIGRMFGGALYDRYKDLINRTPEVRGEEDLKRRLGTRKRDDEG